ncbi:negative regulator of reactive oxygen species-like isoform X1 [Arapaima gigas]
MGFARRGRLGAAEKQARREQIQGTDSNRGSPLETRGRTHGLLAWLRHELRGRNAVKMPVRRFLPWLLCFTVGLAAHAPWGASGYDHHTLCTLSQRTALCNGCQLLSVPVDLPSSTEELQLNNNRITLLKNSCLDGYPGLRDLSLAGNGLETIETDVFAHTRHVENLSLAGNNLYLAYEQTGKALSTLSQLKVLDLSENGLTEDMVPFLLQNMTSLENLSLSRNILWRLDQSLFQHLHHLRELNLESNQLFEIEEGVFDSLPKLQRLSMAFNNLPCLVGFQLTQLVVLNASHNAIEWFVSNQDMEDTFHLETLDLRDNKLFFFPFLPSRSYLRNLLLSGNKRVPLRLFASLPNLSVLDLSHNKVAVCSLEEQRTATGADSVLSLNLRWLDLRYNSLQTIPTQPVAQGDQKEMLETHFILTPTTEQFTCAVEDARPCIRA